MTVDDKSCTNPTAILDQYRGRKNGGVAGSTETCMAIALKVWVGRTQLAPEQFGGLSHPEACRWSRHFEPVLDSQAPLGGSAGW